MSNPAETFATLFRGREDVRGALNEQMVAARITPATYERHILGRESLGVYPLLPEGTVHWACLDFDRLKQGRTPEQAWRTAFEEIKAVRDVLSSAGWAYGLWAERSRRKGGHLWALLDGWADAALVRRILGRAVELAGIDLAAVEIFPKQDRLSEATPVGNYVHLPYFGKADPGTRVMVDWEFGADITLETFLSLARPLPVNALESIADELADMQPRKRPGIFGMVTDSNDPVPCTAPMELHRLAEGEGRNNFALLLAKRLRKEARTEDDAFSRLAAWNDGNTPPLGERELGQVWRQSAKYSSFNCEAAIVRPFCKTECPLYPKVFGEPDEEADEAEVTAATRGQDSVIGPLTILGGDEKQYRVLVDGREVTVTSDQIHGWPAFRKAAMLQLDYYPQVQAFERKGGGKRWTALLNELLAAAERIEPDADLTQRGVMTSLLAEYFSDPARVAVKPADVLLGRYIAYDRLYFRPEHVENYLQNKAPRYTWHRAIISDFLTEHAGLRRVLKSLDGRKVKLWSIDRGALTPDEGEIDEEIPGESALEVTASDPKSYRSDDNGLRQDANG